MYWREHIKIFISQLYRAGRCQTMETLELECLDLDLPCLLGSRNLGLEGREWVGGRYHCEIHSMLDPQLLVESTRSPFASGPSE